MKMYSLCLPALAAALALAMPAAAGTRSANVAQPLFVAPDGDDSAEGTSAAPLRTISRAVQLVAPGGLVYVRGGRYRPDDTIVIDRDGRSVHQRTRLHAYANERPVIDGSDIAGRASVLMLRDVRYWHVAGFEIVNGPFVGVLLSDAEYAIVDRLDVHHNGDSGVYITGTSSRNMIVNVDSHHNYDAVSHGENADGFAVKHGTGAVNLIRGARAWANADDGFDFWEGGRVIVQDSLAWGNGFDVFGHGSGWAGDGNGFKLGRGNGGHLISRSAAWRNARRGFDFNASGANTLLHNTAWANPVNFRFLDHGHVLTNNVAYEGRLELDARVVASHNSWDLGIEGPRFISLDDSIATGPRDARGFILQSGFLKPHRNSPLVDAGVEIGHAFVNSAPDLGAFEHR